MVELRTHLATEKGASGNPPPKANASEFYPNQNLKTLNERYLIATINN
jgi:hypothetical protein